MLVVTGLEVRRGSFVAALSDFYLDDGECVALCGVSGSGKSTLLEALGLITPAFKVKRMVLGNIEVASLPPQQAQAVRISSIGIMPQVGGLIPYLTVRENLQLQIKLALKQQVTAVNPKPLAPLCGADLPASVYLRLKTLQVASEVALADLSGAAREAEYLEALAPYSAALQLDGLMSKFPQELSIGQRQRALFLRAIAHQPRLLLIDEPTSALDPDNARSLFALIDTLAQKLGISILVVTHDVRAAARYRRYSYDLNKSHRDYSLFVPELFEEASDAL